MKVGKALLSWLLTLALLLMPFSGVLVFAADGDPVATPPTITVNINPLDYVTSNTTITIDYDAAGDATLASTDTRLEGTSISTDASFSFTPAQQALKNGAYTLVMEATDSNGATAIETCTFYVVDKVDIGFTYAEDESIIPSDPNATAATHEVTPLDYTMGYGSTADGNVALGEILPYDALTTYNMQYMNEAATLTSVSGIPYQTFDVQLNGKTEGDVIVRYTGSTKAGERIAVKVYNPATAAWDTIGTFIGSDSVSEAVDVATYNDNDVIHVMAVLDYVTNGSDTMIWSTDPQHYTKFEDLHDYYYRVYQYAAEQYAAGEVGYIITTGDLVDDRPSASVAAAQWAVADQAMSYIEAVGMPNGLESGNHDVGDFKKPDYSEGDATVDYSKYLETFPASRYNDKAWFGGSLNNNISHYDLITIGNVDFVILYLGYGVEATDETIAWANDVLQTYSHRTAIVATHQYLEASSAVRDPSSRAQLIFDTIVDPNPNVKMIICGHDDGSLCLEKTASDGRTVYEVLSDYQFVEAEDDDFYENPHYIGSVGECCGDGYIRLMTVQGDTLSSITYSPVTGRYNPYGDRENISIDLNCGEPNRAITTVAFSSYVLGDVTDEALPTTPTAVVITGDTATYHHVSYTTYPEIPEGADNTPVDLAAYKALRAEAEAIDTTPYTEESVLALEAALNAPVLDTAADVQAAYVTLSNAIGALELVKETIDPATLESLYVYDMDYTKWYSNDANAPIGSYSSHIKVTTTEKGGMLMERSAASTNTWPSARYNGTSSIVLKPNNGKVYVNLDVVANSAWCIYLEVTQGNASAGVRLNFAIDNAFNRIDTDGFQGTYQGVYDVTDAFVKNGIDPSCTMTIKRSILYIVPGDVTYDYFELLTDPSTGVVDTSALQALIDSVAELDETVYTTTTWKNLQKALTSAQTALEDATAAQSDINLAQNNLQTYIDKLKKVETIVEEPEGSLLPADEGQWKESAAGTMNIYRDDSNYTVLQNTNGNWPYADYTLPEQYVTTVADHQLSVDITVGDRTNIWLAVDNGGNWLIPLPKYISAANTSGGDLGAGTYTVDIPLSSIAEIAGLETVSIAAVRVYSVGAAESSAVTIRKLMITDYVAPPPVEDELADLIPDSAEDVTIVSGDGTVTIENGVLTAVNNGDGDLRLSYTITDLYDLTVLNALHLGVESEIPFKMALHVLSYNDGTGAWANTSTNYSNIFTIENDRVISGTYDEYLELHDNCAAIADKTAVYHNQVIILLTGKGTFKLNVFEAVAHDTYAWDDDMTTFGPAATPDNPYYQHAAQTAPEVEYKVDLLDAIGVGKHPTITGWVSYGNQALNLEIDLEKTPYLYYSFAQPADSNFTFSIYSNSNYSPWLMFRDATGEGAYLNQGAANWDAYTNREQYVLTSETACIDMRQYLKDPTKLQWIINQITFYNSQAKGVIISYMFFGSAPIPQGDIEGDINGDNTLDVTDVTALYAVVSGQVAVETYPIERQDANGDGEVDVLDVLYLYDVVSGMRAAL